MKGTYQKSLQTIFSHIPSLINSNRLLFNIINGSFSVAIFLMQLYIYLLMLTNRLKYCITLNFIKNLNDKPRNLIIHHGLMGSCKNFRSISKTPQISNYFNTYSIDARNHGESPHTSSHQLSQLAQDLMEFITVNKLNHANMPLTLMGHSMGALALMEFTKRYTDQSVQNVVQRIILIDIPSDSLTNYPSFQKTGKMLKQMNSIDLTLPIEDISKMIDRYALSPAIAALFKASLKVQNSQRKWMPNLKLLAQQGYEKIGTFDLQKDNKKLWRKPVDLIYGQLSNYYSHQHHLRYCTSYPQMSQSNFHEVKGAGHWVHADKTKQFLNVFESIITRRP